MAPVEFVVEVNGAKYTELHADAGNIAQAFVRTPAGIPPGSTIWALSAGKVYRDQLKKRPRVYGLIGGAVSNSLYALFRSDLVKLYALSAVTKSNFRLLALPLEFPVTPSAFAFDPQELVRLYDIGLPDGRGRPGPLAKSPSRHTPARDHARRARGCISWRRSQKSEISGQKYSQELGCDSILISDR